MVDGEGNLVRATSSEIKQPDPTLQKAALQRLIIYSTKLAKMLSGTLFVVHQGPVVQSPIKLILG